VDEHNHALAALRYLVSRIDARQMARNRGKLRQTDGLCEGENGTPDLAKDRVPWLRLDNEALWSRLR
jgi:hypothetical protein